MAATLEFEFGRGDTTRRREDRTVRLLLIGDFGGRALRGPSDAAALGRRVSAVDVDSLDAAVARFVPQIDAPLPDGTRVNLAFAGIDDFHPDQLLNRYEPLAAMMQRRRRLLDPTTFAAAAAEFGAIAGGSKNVSESDRATVSRLLGDSPNRSGKGLAASAAVEAFVRQIAAGADRTAPPEFQSQYLAAVDAAAASQLRALLHTPAFQALEATWRSVHFLVSRLDFDDSLELHLFDATLDELRADAAQAAGDVSRSTFARHLRALADEAADAEADWLLAAGLFSFGAGDLAVLESIGAAALGAGIAFVAGADATIAGACSDPSEWQAPAAEAMAQWRRLRSTKAASAIGLVAPRLLLRLPYGHDTDPIDGFAFEELSTSLPALGELLWGCGALAALFVRAGDSAVFDIDDLPALTFSEDGEQKLQSCAEWLMGERVADRLIDLGLMPLLGSRHRNAVRLVGFRSIV